MSTKFIVLSSLAIGAIYASGYSISATAGSPVATTTQESQNKPPVGDNSTQSTAAANTASSSSPNNSSQNSSKSSTSSSKTSTSNRSSKTSTSSGSSKNTTAAAGSKPVKKKSTAPAVNTTDKYLDGTYNGSASNRIGEVDVAVTTKGGKISNVQITGCYTHYPESDINPVLPNYVVSHQTNQVPVISGATLSTEDFYYAVEQALNQAHNPNYKG